MKSSLLALALSAGMATAAQAGTIDFSSSIFNGSTASVTTTIDGVEFTLIATARGFDRFVPNFNNTGLSFGVPGNGMYSVSITADTDLSFDTLTGNGHSLTNFAGQLPFDLSVEGVISYNDLQFPTTSESTIALGGIEVDAGEAFLIDVDFDALTGSSTYASAKLASLDFSVVQTQPPVTQPTPAVPLPAGFPLLAAALGGLAWVRRKS